MGDEGGVGVLSLDGDGGGGGEGGGAAIASSSDPMRKYRLPTWKMVCTVEATEATAVATSGAATGAGAGADSSCTEGWSGDTSADVT